MSRRVDKKPEGPPEESPVTTCPRQPEGGQVERGVEAAEGAQGGQGGGWWGSWISAAKDKSAEVLGMVKKDLDELSTAVKSEASHVINTTSSAIGKTLRLDEPESTANTMKKSFSTFIDQVNTVLNPSPDDEDTEVYIITDGEPVPLTTLQKEVLALQRLDATFLVPPGDEAGGRLQAWRGVQRAPSPAARQRMLEASPLLREKIHRLVPAALSEDDFWERYLFRKALLEDRLCNLNNPMSYQPSDAVVSSLLEQPGLQQQAVQPSQQPQQVQQPSQQHGSASPEDKGSGGGSDCPSDSVRSNCGSSPILTDRDDCQWDNDFAMDVELSEEQQIKLLEEYEEEIRSAKSNPPAKNPVKPSPTKSVSSPQLNLAKSPTKKTPTVGKIKEVTPLKKAASKSSETVANVQKSITKKLTQKDVKKPVKKSDLQSKLVEDYFVDDTVKVQKASGVMPLSEELTANKIVDNASSNSDESWEKEFEFDDGNAPV